MIQYLIHKQKRAAEAALFVSIMFSSYQAVNFLLRITRSPAIPMNTTIAIRPHSDSVGTVVTLGGGGGGSSEATYTTRS